jgi:hypothetical protein
MKPVEYARARCVKLALKWQRHCHERRNPRTEEPPEVFEIARRFEDFANRGASRLAGRLASLDAAVDVGKLRLDEVMSDAARFEKYILRPADKRREKEAEENE